MQSQRTIFTFCITFSIIYLLIILPFMQLDQTYATFYQKQATWLYTNIGNKGYVLFDMNEENSNILIIKQANKELIDKYGNVESVVYEINTKNLAYLPIALMIALFLASPIKLIRRLVLLLYSLFILHIFLLASLYVIIIHAYAHHASLRMFELSQTAANILDFINSMVENGTGLNSFLVILIWISMLIIFEKRNLQNLINSLNNNQAQIIIS